MARSHVQIEELAREKQSVQIDLHAVNLQLRKSHGDTRMNSREIEGLRVPMSPFTCAWKCLHLQAELGSLQGVSSDSTKLLTEKLTLVRELAALKPEMEHLRDQVIAQQATLAEKLLLQRQLSTLQVELNNEKRSVQKIVHKDNDMRQEDAKLDAQFARLQGELAKERKDKQKVERESQRSSRDLESTIATLESRMEGLKEKLKSAKDQVKNKDAELRIAKTSMSNSKSLDIKSPRKRQFSLVDDDTMIGTPGGGTSNNRGRKKPSTLGEKSTFSITPFLNRASNVDLLSPQSPMMRRSDGQVERHAPLQEFEANLPSAGVEAPIGNKRKSITSEQQPDKQSGRKDLTRIVKGLARLEQVVEEDREFTGHSEPGSEDRCISTAVPRKQNFSEKIKPRSLTGGLGKTLFDDSDTGPIRDRLTVGGPRRLGFNSTQRRGASSMRNFGSFSPLKKDRKGV